MIELGHNKFKLCRDLVDEDFESEGRPAVVTSFAYPNGDSVNLYFSVREDGSLWVSDEGATIDFLKDQDVELTEDRSRIVQSICNAHDIDFNGDRFSMRLDPKTAGTECLRFCEAVTRVSALYYHRAAHEKSQLKEALADVLRRRVEPSRIVIPKWIAPVDQKALYPVDHRVEGPDAPPRHIFYVTSVAKGTFVPSVVYFLRSHSIDTQTMTIVDERVKLAKAQWNRLTDTSVVREGLEGNENAIIEFALGRGTYYL